VSTQRTTTRLRVLVADDDRDTVTLLAVILRDEGHEVHTALRGDEVLELDRLVRPDVVILDINMPGMSGYALAHEIRARRGSIAPLLIAMSGQWTQKHEQLLARDIGFDEYLLKPCEPVLLIRMLRGFALRQQQANGTDSA